MIKKVAVSGNVTVDFIADELKKQTGCEIHCSGFGQYAFDIMNPQSGLYTFEPDAVLLFLDGDTLFEGRTADEAKVHIEDIRKSFRERSGAYLLVCSVVLSSGVDSLRNFNTESNTKKDQYSFNLFLNSMTEKDDRFFVLDFAGIAEKYGTVNLYDEALWFYGSSRLNKRGNELLADEFSLLMKAVQGISCKCLVLDLDNTLWGGVIGEDGIDGIELGGTKTGEVYRKAQQIIAEIAAKGVLLAVCSKNNEADALHVFENHPDMVLKSDDFIVKQINWDNKADNIKAIASRLNIGEDSLVFIDDSPYERELVKSATGAVVPDFPENIESYLSFFKEVDKQYFSRMKLVQEDLDKKRQYAENFARDEAEKKHTSIESYIDSLNIRLKIEEYKSVNLARIAQMTQKTNQFNFTTKRYSEKDISSMAESGYRIFTGTAGDRFGDYGLIILLILKPSGRELLTDTFLMSCRAVGRNIEHAFTAYVLNKFKGEYDTVKAEYIPTAKNILVKDKLDELGFRLEKEEQDGSKVYSAEISGFELPERNMEVFDG